MSTFGNYEFLIYTSKIATSSTFEVDVLGISLGEWMKEGSVFPYYNKSDYSNKASSLINPFLFGTELTTFGDSITINTGGYGKLLADDLGMTLNNLGISGATLPTILSDTQLAKITKASSIITITGGTNAWFVDGAVDSRDVSNTYGLINRALDYIYTNFPNAIVILITPIRSNSTARNDSIKFTATAMRNISAARGILS